MKVVVILFFFKDSQRFVTEDTKEVDSVVWGSTQPPIQLVPGVKWQGRESDHSHTTAEAKKTRVYTSTLPYAFMA
jgi:hypothetical protein